MTSYTRIALGIALVLCGSVVATAQQNDAVASFEKVMSIPAKYDDNFSHAVIAVSNEQKSLISRNFIVAGRSEQKWLRDHPERRGNRLFSLARKKVKFTKLPDSTKFGFIPNSTKIWILNCFGTVQFWDSQTHAKLDAVVPHVLKSECAGPFPAVSPDGSVMATQTLDSLQIWDLRTFKQLSEQDHEWGYDLGFSSDGNWLFTRGGGRLKIRDPKTGKVVAGPFRHDQNSLGFAYSPTKQLATFERNSETEETWKSVAVIRSGAEWSDVRRVSLAGHTREASWIDDSHLLVVADNKLPGQTSFSYGKKLIYVVSLAKDEPEVQTIFRYRWIPSAAVAPDGKHIVATTPESTVCLTIGAAKPLWSKSGNGRVSFSNQGWVLLHRDESAIVYSLATGKELWRKDEVVTSRVDGPQVWLCRKDRIEVWRFQNAAKAGKIDKVP